MTTATQIQPTHDTDTAAKTAERLPDALQGRSTGWINLLPAARILYPKLTTFYARLTPVDHDGTIVEIEITGDVEDIGDCLTWAESVLTA